jgi:hypothetical protein
MVEEKTSHEEFSSDGVPCLDDLLVKHFYKIEEKIRHADSHENALKVVDVAILNFRRECISEIVLEFLKYNMKALVEKHWKGGQKSY